MVNLVIYAVFILAALLVTFFGLGPVLMADGSNQERLMTLALVILLYIVLGALFFLWRRKIHK